MYAGTKVNMYEVLQQTKQAAVVNETLPLFFYIFSSDKGSEKLAEYTASDFKAMFGTKADYFKYGQPLIQAHATLNAGGRVLAQRIVADDATLGNLIISASVESEERNKTNANGEQIYIDEDGTETTEPTDTPAKITVAVVKYTASTMESAKTFEAVVDEARKTASDSVFPLFVITDNGRGVSQKAVKIVPDYDVSKTLSYMLYRIQDIEGTTVVESKRFSVDPDAINVVNNQTKNMALTKNTTVQFQTQYIDTGIDAYIEKLAEITGYETSYLYANDVLFGTTVKGATINGIEFADDSINLQHETGLALQSGSNGVFGDAPFPGETPKDEWTAKAKSFLDGNVTDEIWDYDLHKVDFCVDANYPDAVKQSISYLANWREDFFYFRDMGLDIYSIADIQAKLDSPYWSQSPYIGDYMTVYDTIDINTRKQIPVTMTHGLAPLLVNHYMNNAAAPIAGEFNNFVITEAVKDTIRFTPRISPSVDQKTIIEDLRVNYANYSSDGLLTIQSTYTSQDHWGPLSYSSNVIITQMCIKDIRRYTPKIRFMLMGTSPDFTKYKELIEDNVLSNYKKFFQQIQLEYTRDDEMIAAKVFNASLLCWYQNFPKGEIFDVFAIEGSPDTNNPLEGTSGSINRVSVIQNSNSNLY